ASRILSGLPRQIDNPGAAQSQCTSARSRLLEALHEVWRSCGRGCSPPRCCQARAAPLVRLCEEGVPDFLRRCKEHRRSSSAAESLLQIGAVGAHRCPIEKVRSEKPYTFTIWVKAPPSSSA